MRKNDRFCSSVHKFASLANRLYITLQIRNKPQTPWWGIKQYFFAELLTNYPSQIDCTFETHTQNNPWQGIKPRSPV